MEQWCAQLPHRLRGDDRLCRPTPGEVLLLIAGSATEFTAVRRRLEELWAECHVERGEPEPPPMITDQRIELVSPSDAPAFLAAAAAWVAGR